MPREGIAEAIEKVRASARTERAIAYRKEHGIPIDDTPMPVIVQQMIHAQTSGVVFTANPTTQDTGEIVISALFGLGEGLVSHGFDADTYIVRKDDFSIRAEIVEKTEAIGVRVENPKARSLSDAQVKELAREALAIENAFGGPQDIEFAFDANGLWILQTRPITTIRGNRLLWDNSNIVESFSGVTSPMTFSVIRRAYAIVYRLFAQVMGIPDEVVKENKYVFENTLGLFRGQVFYNLLNWYAMVRLFPGYEQNRQFMESMMGVRESVAAEPARPNRLAMIPLAWRMLRNFSSIDRLTREFEANFKKHYDQWSRIDFNALKPHELMRLYYEFEDRVLWSWRAPIINDFFVMIFYGTLKKLTPLHNDLLAGEGGIESTEPANMLLRIADMARPNASLSDAIQRGDLQAAKQHPEFAKEFDRYMELYGFRGMNELKLEEPPLRDRPDVVLMFIQELSGQTGLSVLHDGCARGGGEACAPRARLPLRAQARADRRAQSREHALRPHAHLRPRARSRPGHGPPSRRGEAPRFRGRRFLPRPGRAVGLRQRHRTHDESPRARRAAQKRVRRIPREPRHR